MSNGNRVPPRINLGLHPDGGLPAAEGSPRDESDGERVPAGPAQLMLQLP